MYIKSLKGPQVSNHTFIQTTYSATPLASPWNCWDSCCTVTQCEDSLLDWRPSCDQRGMGEGHFAPSSLKQLDFCHWLGHGPWGVLCKHAFPSLTVVFVRFGNETSCSYVSPCFHFRFPRLSLYQPVPFLEVLPLVTAGFLFTGGAWKAECSLHRRSWKLMNFHIMKACVMQMEARTAILKTTQKQTKN